jgi:hypothetical protein
MIIDLNKDTKNQLNFYRWTLFELYNENNEFLYHIDLNSDGFIRIKNPDLITRWCLLKDKLFLISNKNNIKIIFELLDTSNIESKGINLITKKNCFLKQIII